MLEGNGERPLRKRNRNRAETASKIWFAGAELFWGESQTFLSSLLKIILHPETLGQRSIEYAFVDRECAFKFLYFLFGLGDICSLENCRELSPRHPLVISSFMATEKYCRHTYFVQMPEYFYKYYGFFALFLQMRVCLKNR